MSREVHVRFCERRRVRLPPPTLLVVIVAGTRADAQALKAETAAVLAPVGLGLSEAKTRITHIDEGRGIVNSCGSPVLGDHAATSCTSSGRSTITPLSNLAPARTSATRCGPLTARQRSWAASRSLKAIARPAALEPGPLVTRVRSRTEAKVDSIGLLVFRCSQCSAG